MPSFTGNQINIIGMTIMELFTSLIQVPLIGGLIGFVLVACLTLAIGKLTGKTTDGDFAFIFIGTIIVLGIIAIVFEL